jgi:hypothetical protein
MSAELHQDSANPRTPTHTQSRKYGLAESLRLYEEHVEETFDIDTLQEDLAGKDLACWCPITEPCHADVLLEIANRH